MDAEEKERCPACRARLDGADVCARCGCDFSLARRAERTAQGKVRQAVREWASGQRDKAVDSLATAINLSNPPLAHILVRLIRS